MTAPIRHLAPALLAFLLLTLAAGARAESITIDIYGPGQSQIYLAMAQPLAADAAIPTPAPAARLNELVRQNLGFLPFMRLVPDEAVLGGTKLAGYTRDAIDFKRFQLAEADLLFTAGWPGAQGKGETVELRVYEAFSGALVLGKAYYDVTESLLPDIADKFCAELMKALTGRGEFFNSVLAYVKREGPGKTIWTTHPTGRDNRRLVSLPGFNLSPSFSPGATHIAFTNIGERYHTLGICDVATRQVRKIRYPGNTIIAPTFTPESTIAVSLSAGGNPDIYLLDRTFHKDRALELNWAIDVSPSFDRTGKLMAFVSSRLGNPHVFLKNLDSGEVKRVTYNGTYNTQPSISPDGELVAFTRLTSQGHRIFVMDMKTGVEKQISFGPGNDEQPAFAPDGYFVAFSSNRDGGYKIYLNTRHGGDPKLVPTGPGDATFPDWGLPEKR